MIDVVAKLEKAVTNIAGLATRFDFANEYVRLVSGVEMHQDIGMIGAHWSLNFYAFELDGWDFVQDRFECFGHTLLELFHRFRLFQHMLKIAIIVKVVNNHSLDYRLSAFAETEKN